MSGKIFYIICGAIIILLFIKTIFFPEVIPLFEGEHVCNGTIISEPDIRSAYTYIDVKTNGTCFHYKVRLKVDTYPKYFYGDILSFKGTFETPEDFETETGRVFHYRSFLYKDGIVAISRDAEVVMQGVKIFSLQRMLLKTKAWFTGVMSTMLPSPHAELLGGLLVGAKQSLGEALLEDFRRVGLIHIVVLSGFNVVVIIAFVRFLLQGLPLRLSLSITALFVILFTLLVGLEPPIVRASCMALISLWALSKYRTYSVHRAFILTVTAMAIQNPLILLYDPSFQLSALATAGLLYVVPCMEKWFLWIPTSGGMREIVVSTIATYITVAPFLLYLMGELSVVSLVVNLLVLPIIPITMLVGCIATLLVALTGFGFLFEYATYYLLSYELYVVDIFSTISFATVTFDRISPVVVVIMYVVLLGLIVWRYKSSDI